MCPSLSRWKLWHNIFSMYRMVFSISVCACISLFHPNKTQPVILAAFVVLVLFVHSSVFHLHRIGIIQPLQGSIDRTVTEMIKNDMVKDVKELEMFGSSLDERKVGLFRHTNNESLWMRAFKSVNVKNMKYLLNIDQNIDVNEQDKQNGRSPIIYATMKNDVHAIKLLLDQPGIDVNHCHNDGNCALSYAASNGDMEIVRLLIPAGADVNIYMPNDKSLFMYCFEKANFNIAQLLAKSGAGAADADFLSNYQESCHPQLIAAMNNNNTDLVKSLLILNKVEPDLINHALSYAIQKGNLECTKLIVQAGADVSSPIFGNEKGETPLIVAVNRQHLAITKYLIENTENAANVNQQDKYGCNALYHAAKRDQLKIVSLLCDQGVDVNVQHKRTGRTPLMIAAVKQNWACVSWLQDNKDLYGLDASLKDVKGKTAEDYCSNAEIDLGDTIGL